MSPPRSPITCHVLDTGIGKPASNVQVSLQKGEMSDGASSAFVELANGSTDSDGRCSHLLPPETKLAAGVYKVVFRTESYFVASNRACFHPYVEVSFNYTPGEHHHIPLVISPYSYTTYRGT